MERGNVDAQNNFQLKGREGEGFEGKGEEVDA